MNGATQGDYQLENPLQHAFSDQRTYVDGMFYKALDLTLYRECVNILSLMLGQVFSTHRETRFQVKMLMIEGWIIEIPLYIPNI